MANEQAPANNAHPNPNAKIKMRWPGLLPAASWVGGVAAAVTTGALLTSLTGGGGNENQGTAPAPSPTRAPQVAAALSCRLETVTAQGSISPEGAKVVIRALVNPDGERIYLATAPVGNGSPEESRPHVTPHPRQAQDAAAPAS